MRWFASTSTHPRRVNVYTDGSIRPEAGASGLAAVVRDVDGQVLYLWHRRVGKMTCNEAEYAAVTLALEYLRSVKPQDVHIYSDSQVVVQQMQGMAATRAPRCGRLNTVCVPWSTNMSAWNFTISRANKIGWLMPWRMKRLIRESESA